MNMYNNSIYNLKTILLLIFVISPTFGASLKSKILSEWNLYKLEYNKNYTNFEEDTLRMENFKNTLEIIQRHNEKYQKGEAKYWMGFNKFSDWTTEEKNKLNGFKRKKRSFSGKSRSEVLKSFISQDNLPESINWIKKGAVTDVKDQLMCGSCWAFSTVGSLEGQMIIKYNKTDSLSTQNLIDCSWLYGNNGCDGGMMLLGFEYVLHNPGLDTEDSYPYKGEDSDCRFQKGSSEVKITEFVQIPSKNEDKLKEAVAKIGPITVGITADENLLAYSGGVFKESGCSTDDLNHGVLVVGYDTKSPDGPYWIVKNSWGRGWGEDGYFRMAMGTNMCGIATDASYPIV